MTSSWITQPGAETLDLWGGDACPLESQWGQEHADCAHNEPKRQPQYSDHPPQKEDPPLKTLGPQNAVKVHSLEE